ncbi:MAG: sporulation transcriptional regulator SpoIIID [Clostridia bacterium]|nr:sporulation transcriptional regulator SpoIIID [Clostridia bacterium]
MREDIIDRIIEEANYIAETGATVRATASIFHFSKSTVHKDVSERLKKIDKELYARVRKVLNNNLEERHIRGGLATKKKYKTIKERDKC